MDAKRGQGKSLIELGWVLAGELEEFERRAIRQARDQVLRTLSELLPEFEWRMPIVYRRRVAASQVVQPTVMLDSATTERAARHWDFAFLVTDADLVSYFTPWAMGMPSRALGVAVMSIARLEPSYESDQDFPTDRLAKRLESLALHLFGHLNGLGHSEDRNSVLWEVSAASDLDRFCQYGDEELEGLRNELREVADLRLEEQPGRKLGPIAFHLETLWHNREGVWGAVRQIAPWKFPLRFSKLTIAGLSTLFILLITAESWDLGMSQPPAVVTVFAILSVLGTTLFLLIRQKLLVHRGTRKLTEQTAVSNLAVVISVGLGMLVTWTAFFLFALAFAQIFFTPVLARGWAAELDEPIRFGHYLTLAGFVSTLGILIGGLGASFEAESYFRHVALVDEET